MLISKITDDAWDWIMGALDRGFKCDVKGSIRLYIKEKYGELIEKEYGSMSDSFISLTVDKLYRSVKKREVYYNAQEKWSLQNDNND